MSCVTLGVSFMKNKHKITGMCEPFSEDQMKHAKALSTCM